MDVLLPADFCQLLVEVLRLMKLLNNDCVHYSSCEFLVCVLYARVLTVMPRHMIHNVARLVIKWWLCVLLLWQVAKIYFVRLWWFARTNWGDFKIQVEIWHVSIQCNDVNLILWGFLSLRGSNPQFMIYNVSSTSRRGLSTFMSSWHSWDADKAQFAGIVICTWLMTTEL